MDSSLSAPAPPPLLYTLRLGLMIRLGAFYIVIYITLLLLQFPTLLLFLPGTEVNTSCTFSTNLGRPRYCERWIERGKMHRSTDVLFGTCLHVFASAHSLNIVVDSLDQKRKGGKQTKKIRSIRSVTEAM